MIWWSVTFRVRILSSAIYVERRGKSSTCLPGQKLAEERIPSVATKIENLLRTCNVIKIEMWSGAVNRQPGDRARNLQRRGYRTPPPRSKIFSDARRHHDRKFSPDFFCFDTFICIHINVYKKTKKKEIGLMTQTDFVTFDLPRELQSIWDFQEISPQRQRPWGFAPEWKQTCDLFARVKNLPEFSPKLRFMFSGDCPRFVFTYRVDPLLCKLLYEQASSRHSKIIQKKAGGAL